MEAEVTLRSGSPSLPSSFKAARKHKTNDWRFQALVSEEGGTLRLELARA